MWNVSKSDGSRLESGRIGQSPNRGRPIGQWVERLLFISGLILLSIYGVARIDSILSSRAALKKFDAVNNTAITSGRGDETTRGALEPMSSLKDAGTANVDFRLWDRRRVQAYKETSTQESDAPVGVLRISKIHLEVPLFEGTDDLTLNHGVGRIAGTAQVGEPGNIGIAGHRDGFFRGLKDIRTGDVIELRSIQGTDAYVVSEVRIVTPEDVSVLRPRPVPSITLVTCYPFYFIGSAPQRYIVTAFLSREVKGGSADSETPTAISNLQFNKEKQ